ncbi:MAG TPA: addiction module protein [Blastocatellia bacterium]|nr:addiction module protein [Blastocatellia bacterium]
MAITVEELIEQALTLSSESRARLANLLVDSLDAGELGRINRLCATEATRRRDDVRSGEVEPIAGEEGLRKVRESLER